MRHELEMHLRIMSCGLLDYLYRCIWYALCFMIWALGR